MIDYSTPRSRGLAAARRYVRSSRSPLTRDFRHEPSARGILDRSKTQEICRARYRVSVRLVGSRIVRLTEFLNFRQGWGGSGEPEAAHRGVHWLRYLRGTNRPTGQEVERGDGARGRTGRRGKRGNGPTGKRADGPRGQTGQRGKRSNGPTGQGGKRANGANERRVQRRNCRGNQGARQLGCLWSGEPVPKRRAR